ncbi:MAG TPA: lytic transglycosylase domain-containing protein, partial [Acidimicrobiales bacterium]|nr:lytic transglycosylase domain-containing protein [Acidimicrobiales bacterium]
LQGSAARRRHLDGRMTELEANIARLEAEEQAAANTLSAAQVAQANAAGRLDAATAELRQAQGQVWAAIFRAPAGPSGAAAGEVRPATGAAAGSGRAGLGRSPLDHSAVARVPLGPAVPAATSPGPDVAEALRTEREVRGRVDAVRAELTGARARTLEARRATADAWQLLEGERQALGALRRELSAALLAPDGLAQGGALGTGVAPSARALADIPAEYLALYQEAAKTCAGLPWTVLAAIGSIESSHGRSLAPGVHSGANFAGASGPMQFLAPTWSAYGVDGNKDGRRDVYNPTDAVHGAANYLCASGGGDPGRLPDAIWAYNHADWYVDDVLILAFRYGGGGLEANAADVADLLANRNLTLTDRARADLVNGIVDPRVVNLLAAAASEHRISVSVFKTGHSQFVAGTDRVSNHFHGRAVDIYAVDGAPVSPSNDAALDLALAMLTGAPALQPDELGSPWPGLSKFPGAFSDAGHQGHLHIGWSSATP